MLFSKASTFSVFLSSSSFSLISCIFNLNLSILENAFSRPCLSKFHIAVDKSAYI